jgi:hypothetical protein
MTASREDPGASSGEHGADARRCQQPARDRADGQADERRGRQQAEAGAAGA